MSKEQNIDDILQLLKDSFSNESTDESITGIENSEQNISNEALQEQLKNQYISTTFDSHEEEKEDSSDGYIIDNDFLAEAVLSEEETEEELDAEKLIDTIDVFESTESNETASIILEEIVEEIVAPVVDNDEDEQSAVEESADEDELPVDNVDELIASMSPIYNEEFNSDVELDEEVDGEEIFDEILFDVDRANDEEDMPEDNVKELISSMEPIIEEIALDFDTPEFSEQEQIYADTSLDDEIHNQTKNEEEILLENSDVSFFDSEPEISESTPIAEEKEEKHETFLASMRKTGIDFTTDEIYNSTVEKIDSKTENITEAEADILNTLGVEEKFEEAPITADEELDLSTINLMMQFCEKQELEKTIGDEKVDSFLKAEDITVTETDSYKGINEKEYVDASQNDEIVSKYKRNHTNALLSMLGCIAIALLALVYELLPLFKVELSGILSYVEYPAVYALLGLQFVAFAAAICYKKLWNGLKRAFSLTPNTYSIIAIILGLTAIYDTVVVIILSITGDALPSMYNAIAVIVTALLASADYLTVVLEMKAFDVYSSSAQKYTAIKEDRHGRIGAKMYDGGLEEDKSVYSIKSIDFPNGFFRSIKAKQSKNKLLTVLIIPVLIIGIIASVVAAILGSSAYASSAAFIVCVYAILPVVLIFTEILPYAVAMIKLSKRGSAFAGIEAVKKYENCNVFVFNDLHMFKKCKTEDVGIAIYDTSVGYLVLGCIDALYSKIGGPLSGMKMNLPDVFKFQNVSIKRITKNGIEAIIDKKHSLIVGEASFLQRYGLNFPPNEKENGRSTLCVSLNGKISAKLSVKYEAEPVFEMLVERLNKEGISCAIQTYDPLINSTVVASARNIGDSPISVVHMNSEDFVSEKNNRYRSEADGVIACGSRLKLAELLVWLKKLSKLNGITQKIAIAFSIVGAVSAILFLVFGIMEYVNQLYILLYLLAEAIIILVLTFTLLPTSKYFTVDALYAELEKSNAKLIERQQREEQRYLNKNKQKKPSETNE